MKRQLPLALLIAIAATTVARPVAILAQESPNGTLVQQIAPQDATAPPEDSKMLASGLWMVDQETDDQGDLPRKYSMRITIPQIGGAPAAAVAGFNREVQALVQRDVDDFRGNVSDLVSPSNPNGPGSFLSVGYTLSSANGRVISLFVNTGGYVEGAAHPYAFSRAFNYDVVAARQMDLYDLFDPESDFLPRLSDMTVAQLAPKLGADGFFSAGADPTLENYENWNLRPDGLVIKFNEYQVAPYAAGPQIVTIPYGSLDDILRNDDRLLSVRPRE